MITTYTLWSQRFGVWGDALAERAHGSRLARWLRSLPAPARVILIVAAALGALSLYYLAIALTFVYNSDHAVPLMVARDVMQGNVWLRGWTFAGQNFFSTDVPYYIAGILLLGFNPNALYAVSALQWGMIALAVMYLGATDENERFSGWRLFSVLCLSALIGTFMRSAYILGGQHQPAWAYGLIGLAAVRAADRTGKWPYYVMYGAFIFMSTLGDDFGTYVLAIPVGFVCTVRIVAYGPQRSEVRLLALTLLGVAAAKGAVFAIGALGGFQTDGFPPVLAEWSQVRSRLSRLLEVLLGAFDVHMAGYPLLHRNAILGAIHISALGLLAACTVRATAILRNSTLFMQTVWAVVVLNLLENILVDASIATRYVAPTVLFGVVLVTHVLDRWVALRPHRLMTALYLGALAVSLLLRPLSLSRPATPYDSMGALLRRLGLSSGYAPFWRSEVLTLWTGAKVNVLAVYLRDGREIAPVWVITPTQAYAEFANFLIIDANDTSGLQPTRENATRVFGLPAQEHEIPGYGYLLIWDHDISPYLAAP